MSAGLLWNPKVWPQDNEAFTEEVKRAAARHLARLRRSATECRVSTIHGDGWPEAVDGIVIVLDSSVTPWHLYLVRGE